MDDKQISLAFAAIDKELQTYIPNFEEKDVNGKNWVSWGDESGSQPIPNYLFDLFTDVSTLKTIILGTSDYVAGDDAVCNVKGFETQINSKGDNIYELLHWLSRDWLIYGGFAIQVIKSKGGGIAELYYIDFRHLRASKDKNLFWYTPEWGKKYSRKKPIVYPKFTADGEAPSSIVYVTNEKSRVYPIPLYSGALKSCEIQRHIDELHLVSLDQGFMPSGIVNLTSGIPDDSVKADIEKNFTEKFTSSKNCGRIVLNFSDSEEHKATFEPFNVTDFGDKYQAASKRSTEQIYCSFRAIPQIFGLMSESTGFNSQEFSESFRIFNRTMVKPIQRLIGDTLDKIFQTKGSITIKPFSIEENNNNTEKTVE